MCTQHEHETYTRDNTSLWAASMWENTPSLALLQLRCLMVWFVFRVCNSFVCLTRTSLAGIQSHPHAHTLARSYMRICKHNAPRLSKVRLALSCSQFISGSRAKRNVATDGSVRSLMLFVAVSVSSLSVFFFVFLAWQMQQQQQQIQCNQMKNAFT